MLLVCNLRSDSAVDMALPFPSEPDEKDSFVDVVDENDHIVGEATFAKVHSFGAPLTHRGSHVIFFDTAGRLLLNRRTSNAYNWPSRWGFRGEHSKQGESYEACARRLLMEEMNMTRTQAKQKLLVTLRRATRFTSKNAAYPDDVFCWQYVSIFSGDIFDTDEKESSGRRWITLSELYRWMDVTPEDFLDYDPPLFPAQDVLEVAYKTIAQESAEHERT